MRENDKSSAPSNWEDVKVDKVVKSLKFTSFVILAKDRIQYFQ
jgi:hypothetical protein